MTRKPSGLPSPYRARLGVNHKPNIPGLEEGEKWHLAETMVENGTVPRWSWGQCKSTDGEQPPALSCVIVPHFSVDVLPLSTKEGEVMVLL